MEQPKIFSKENDYLLLLNTFLKNQSGFMPGRQMANLTRRVLNVINKIFIQKANLCI